MRAIKNGLAKAKPSRSAGESSVAGSAPRRNRTYNLVTKRPLPQDFTAQVRRFRANGGSLLPWL